MLARHTLNVLETLTTNELQALYADLGILLADPDLTDADRVALRTILGHIRLVLHRRRLAYPSPGW